MPDIGNLDVQACRNALAYESPTEILLAIWGSKGNTIIQLYNCLGRAKLVRAMKAMRHLGSYYFFVFLILTFSYCTLRLERKRKLGQGKMYDVVTPGEKTITPPMCK